MKSHFLISLTIFFVSVLFYQCTSDDENGESPVPVTKVQDILPQPQIDSLISKGMAINEGQNPPDIQGVFNQSPVILTARASSSDYPLGKLFADYRYEFYDQDVKTNQVKVNYKSIPGSDAAKGQGAYVLGSGNKFTILSENKGTDHSVSYTSITIISGEITVNGIKNMQLSFFIKSKGSDPQNLLLPAGQVRILADRDKFSEKTTNYRLAALEGGNEAPSISSNPL